MKEDFVQTVWKYQLFNSQHLVSIDGKAIEIIHPGYAHVNAGPDFISAKIKIDGILWAGNVEIHVNAAEWYHHQHHKDAAYNNVILHVVFTDDGGICTTQNNLQLHTLELKNLIDAHTLQAYQHLCADMRELPCKDWWVKIEKSIVENWLLRLCIERLMGKCQYLKARLNTIHHHWDQLFFEIVARQLGFHINAEPMERLAKSIKIEWLQKLNGQPLSIEALLFGQAGMLQRTFEEEYPNELKKEYEYLQKKYKLVPMDMSTWKFSRLRPSNFPTLRIAQLASIFRKNPRFFSEIIALTEMEKVEDFFDIKLPEYWNTHYRFEKESAWQLKQFGVDSVEQLIQNTVCIIWLLYGDVKCEEEYKIKCLQLLEHLKPERNRYTKQFDGCNYPLESSIQSQGQRFLWENYCDHKKCLTCSIGIHGLKYS
jgi:hypothetical protein